MDDTRNVAQYREEDVDQKVGVATTLEENTDRWEEDGENDLTEVTVATRQVTNCSHYAANPRRKCLALRLEWWIRDQHWRSSHFGFDHNRESHT